jgi:hypothetical protein
MTFRRRSRRRFFVRTVAATGSQETLLMAWRGPPHVWYLWSEMISTGQHQNASGFQIGRLRGDYPVSALGYSSSAHAARRKKAADQVLWPAL